MSRIPIRVPLSLDAEEQSELQRFITSTHQTLSLHCTHKPPGYLGIIDCQHIYVTPEDWGTHLDSDLAFDAISQYSLKALELAHGIGLDLEQRMLNEYGLVMSVLPETQIAVFGTPWFECDADDAHRSIVIATPSLKPDKAAPLGAIVDTKLHR